MPNIETKFNTLNMQVLTKCQSKNYKKLINLRMLQLKLVQSRSVDLVSEHKYLWVTIGVPFLNLVRELNNLFHNI